jgi:hypothetical protein
MPSTDTAEDYVVALMAERERFRAMGEMRTFVYATGRTVIELIHPWESDPADARVLVTPPPFSVS